MSELSDSIRAAEAARAALAQEANDTENAEAMAQAAFIVSSTFLVSADIVNVYGVSYVLRDFGPEEALFDATIAGLDFTVAFSGFTVKELDRVAHTVTLIPALNTKENGVRFRAPIELAQFFDDIETGVYLPLLVRREKIGNALSLLLLVICSACVATAVVPGGAFWFLLVPAVAASFAVDWIWRNMRLNRYASAVVLEGRKRPLR
jgi:hypothetical protein